MFEGVAQPPSPATEPLGWGKPLFAALLSLLIPGLGQAYNRKWKRTLAFVAVTLLLESLFTRTRLWATFWGLLVVMSLHLLWRLFAVADAAVQTRKRLSDPALQAPVAAMLASLAIIAVAGVIEFYGGRDWPTAFRAFRMPSRSMCPTLCDGDRIIADMKAFRSQQPQRGEVVMFLFDQETALHVKRVIAVGGDQISNSGHRLLVNGSPIEIPSSACGTTGEASTDYQLAGDIHELLVPKNQIFLIGDNLDNSYDSRFYGALDVSCLRGKPLYLYWSRDGRRIGCHIK